MPKFKKPKYAELYGKYEDFNEKQIEYLKFLTNPENKLKKYTDDDIAKILGIDRRTLYNYRQDEKFREAVNKEELLKAADDIPDQISDLTNMSLGRGKYKDISIRERLQAKKLWWSISGFLDDAKTKSKKVKEEVHSSFEQRLIEYDRKYRKDNPETEE